MVERGGLRIRPGEPRSADVERLAVDPVEPGAGSWIARLHRHVHAGAGTLLVIPVTQSIRAAVAPRGEAVHRIVGQRGPQAWPTTRAVLARHARRRGLFTLAHPAKALLAGPSGGRAVRAVLGQGDLDAGAGDRTSGLEPENTGDHRRRAVHAVAAIVAADRSGAVDV